MKILLAIAAFLLLMPSAFAIDISYNICFNSTVLLKHTNITETVNASTNTTVENEYVNCPFGCDGYNRVCNTRIMGIEGFAMLMGLMLIFLVLSHQYNMWLYAMIAGSMALLNAFILWQGMEIEGIIYSARNDIYVPTFAIILLALGLFLVISSGLVGWKKK